MRQNKKILVVTAILIAIGLYAYVYKDWFRPAEMQIYDRMSAGRPMRGSARTNQINISVVAFGFDRAYLLTDVKVVSIAELATNKYAHPLWHLVSDSNSIPVKGFNYGEHIRGMHPQVKKARPEPLEANVTYRILLEAKGGKGQHDFKISGKNVSGK